MLRGEAMATQLAGKYLTFKLAEEEYGLQILKVKEIIGLTRITRVPRTPGFIRGVINLRGKVIPVMDLRTRFGMSQVDDTAETCIIVVEVMHQDRSLLIGGLVDSVSEVRDIAQSNIEETPEFGTDVDTGFILGMGKSQEKVIILLDIDRVISFEELAQIESSVAQEE
ncbi:chemotaxis protein CheW [bacterium]|nr:chemotaxis protein CheW [bacterium]